MLSQQPKHLQSLRPTTKPRYSCEIMMALTAFSPPSTRSGCLYTCLCPWSMGNYQTLAYDPSRVISLLLPMFRWTVVGSPLANTGTFCLKSAGSTWGPNEIVLHWFHFHCLYAATSCCPAPLGPSQPCVLTWWTPTSDLICSSPFYSHLAGDLAQATEWLLQAHNSTSASPSRAIFLHSLPESVVTWKT